MSMPPLFRPEALEGQRQTALGRIQLTRPPSLGWLIALVLVVATLLSAFLYWGEYTRKARLAGVLVPDRGLIRLAASQAATVIESHVREGATVRQGEVLFELAIEAPSRSIDSQRAVSSSLAERKLSLRESARQAALLEDSRARALESQIAQLGLEREQLEAESALQAQRLQLAEQAQRRLESLRQENFVSPAQVQAKAEEVLGLRAEALRLGRQRVAQQRDIRNAEAALRELPIRSKDARDELERELSALAQTQAEVEPARRITLRAPQDGVITAVQAQPGQLVAVGATLAGLWPADAPLQAHLFAPSSAVGFVRVDQAVRLRYDAFAYQKFGHQQGRVVQVSRSPLSTGDLATATPGMQNTRPGEPLYRITVALQRQTVAAPGEALALVPGMQLEADVQLERRRLIEWLFEPLLGMAGRV